VLGFTPTLGQSGVATHIIREAAKWIPQLTAACEVWKEIKFEFDTIDVV